MIMCRKSSNTKKGGSMMIYSDIRKLCLSGWLKQEHIEEFLKPIKFQKFLLFYESFSKTLTGNGDFSNLKGYIHGPVFSTVWGDYTKEKSSFEELATDVYNKNKQMIDNDIAEKCAFLVKVTSEEELSDLSHQLNIWSTKKNRIERGEQHVKLSEVDFNENDMELIRTLNSMFPIDIIKNSEVVQIHSKCFVFNKNDYSRITLDQLDVLETLAISENLHNPVYVEIDGEGRLILD